MSTTSNRPDALSVVLPPLRDGLLPPPQAGEVTPYSLLRLRGRVGEGASSRQKQHRGKAGEGVFLLRVRDSLPCVMDSLLRLRGRAGEGASSRQRNSNSKMHRPSPPSQPSPASGGRSFPPSHAGLTPLRDGLPPPLAGEGWGGGEQPPKTAQMEGGRKQGRPVTPDF